MDPIEKHWLSERLDRIDSDNTTIMTKLDAVTTKVHKHEVYWSVVKWIGLSGTGLAASIAALFKLGHKS